MVTVEKGFARGKRIYVGIDVHKKDWVEYDSSWPEVFSAEARQVRVRLQGVALGIEHIGSSAVPGLRGKPIADISFRKATHLMVYPEITTP